MTDQGEARPLDEILSKREQQVMEVVHRLGEATAADVYSEVPDAPSYNAIRAVLRLLEEKRRLTHAREGRRFVYRATVSAERAGRDAFKRLIQTFFGGSREQLLTALVESRTLSLDELNRLQGLIDQARARVDEEA